MTQIKNYLGAYADFEDSPEFDFLWRRYIFDETLSRSMFRDVDRIKLTRILLDRLIKDKNFIKFDFVKSIFCIHNDFELYGTYRFKFSERENHMDDRDIDLLALDLFEQEIPVGVKNEWTGWFESPVTKLRDYFGEKIAMYFAFLSFYTVLLLFPSIIGIAVFVIQVIYTKGETQVIVLNTVFSVMMVVWSSYFISIWKRSEKRYAIEWGQVDFEEDEIERSKFKGIYRRSPITDHKEKYYSYFKRCIRIAISWFVTLIMIAIVIGLIYFSFWLRNYLYKRWKDYWYADYSMTVVSIINAIIIIVFNYIYFYLAIVLTYFENFKTQTQFERSLIIKNICIPIY